MTFRANVWTVVSLALFAAACGDSIGPRATSPTAPVLPSVSPFALPPAATLVASTFIASRGRSLGGTSFAYDLKVQLLETGKKSGASVTSLIAYLSDGSTVREKDYGCGSMDPNRPQNHVSPGGTWDIEQMGYCEPVLGSSASVTTATVEVTFVDDEGVPGRLTASAEVQ
jgi:hypothetical protein